MLLKAIENNPTADDDYDQASGSGSGRGTKGKSKSAQKQGLGVNSNLDGVTADRAEYVSNMSKKELENLLKHGAYDIFREEKDGQAEAESNRFYEDDIDQILQRSSVVIHDNNKVRLIFDDPSFHEPCTFLY